MRNSILTAALIVLVSVAFAGAAHGADPVQRTVVTNAFRGVAAPAHYLTFGHSLWELAPGGYGAFQSTTLARFYTVTAGELTATVGDKTDVYGVGKGFTVPAGVLASVRNNGKTTTVRFMLSSFITAGAPSTGVAVQGTASPTDPPKQLSGRGGNPAQVPATIDLIQSIVDYEPGFRTPTHVMNHPHFVTILSGEVTFGYLDGSVERYTAGQTAIMTPGRPGYMANETREMATYQITWLQTPGTALTSPVTSTPATALPRTGSGGHLGATGVNPVALLVGAALGGAGGLARVLMSRRPARAGSRRG